MIHDALARMAEAALRLRMAIGGSDTLAQRLVRDRIPDPAAIWVHGASVGELTSARTVIEALASAHPLIVTANSVTGRDMVQGWGIPARLAPLDVPGALQSFLTATRPCLAVTIENEFWPLRSRMLADAGVAQAMIGARISERSWRRWRRMRGIIAPMLARIDALSAQDAGSEDRLLALGLRPGTVVPRLDLKLLTPASVVPPPEDAARDRTILAASTHEGEDAAILDAFATTRGATRLILAPRHPRRAPEIMALIRERGIPATQRSLGADSPPEGGVLLADTLGEMPRWYAAAGICIIGGTIVDHGGHTPWEPAAHRCALLRGPHIGNFTEGFAALRDCTLPFEAAALQQLLDDAPRRRAMGQAARDVLDARAGDQAGLVARLSDLAKTGPRPDMSLR
ncbi:glycosyltransferase N-terminal domain-containing protein [Paracoccus sp. 1_MG-2023]|uniref:3-deoxy-D-manno-octulosonic acid transferase n=1 Tax=unclassified Paracoccus (in: a-proteobacteria) TaxID=2688777 RepID=UPI001C088124|nr:MULTISPECIES: glycosyltransferase N-terminal domain-containing protein [unclassified Paracoccus (in: a-proteobacteria)]MBU2959214.1 3-deoxy-D-manno-octulosonic acid transferase [Paracoccus sp. C2R09]MDO6670324.1 glycosyltransferase N-terminal domain-containing protein [Paracoccus sp. 1_MG-2023]